MYYYSPFPISEETNKKLNLSGIKRVYNKDSITKKNTYLFYDRPDLIFENYISINQEKKITLGEIISSYESDSLISYFLNHAIQNKTLNSNLKDLKKKNHNYEILLKELDQLKSYQDLSNAQYLQLCNAKKLFTKMLLISKKINAPVNISSKIYFDKFSQIDKEPNGISLQVQALLSAYSYSLDRAKKILKNSKNS